MTVLNELKEKIIMATAKEIKMPYSSEPLHTTYLSTSTENYIVYGKRLDGFTEKINIIKNDPNLKEKERKERIGTYKKAAELLATEVCTKDLLDNNEHCRERFAKEQNYYNSRVYFEYNLKDLGYENYADWCVFGLTYYDIPACENNKRYIYNKIKGNKKLVQIFKKAYNTPIKELGEDLYFDKFSKLSEDEKIKMVRDNMEITHVAIELLDDKSSERGIVLQGDIEPTKLSSVIDIRDNSNRLFEVIDNYKLTTK